jgi:hypothetical protein
MSVMCGVWVLGAFVSGGRSTTVGLILSMANALFDKFMATDTTT